MSKKIFDRMIGYRIGFIFSLLFFITFSTIFSQSSFLIKIGIYQNPQKLFLKEDGTPSEFWVDIFNYIDENQDWRVELVEGSWEQCLSMFEDGEIDIMADVAFTEKRDELCL